MGHVVSKNENLLDHDKVVVHSTNSKVEDLQFEGDEVIVTVPLGVLKQQLISFDPPLGPKYDQTIDSYSVAALSKTFMEFDEVVLPKDNDQFVFYPAPDSDNDHPCLNHA